MSYWIFYSIMFVLILGLGGMAWAEGKAYDKYMGDPKHPWASDRR